MAEFVIIKMLFSATAGGKLFRKILIAVVLWTVWAGAAFCAPAFDLENGVRLSSASVHCVTPIAGGYRMYFSTPSAYDVFSASSVDGLDWTIEPGVRLSTRAAFLDASSITSMGLYYDAALAGGPYHAYYVGVNTNGQALLSAKSADGLAWTKDSAFSITFNGGAARLRSPKAYYAGAGKVHLYYIRDSGSAPDPAAYRIYGMQSADNGATFSGETLLLDTTGAYQLDVSTLTDGTLRMFLAAPDVAGSTITRVLAADSATGSSFLSPPALVFSTGAAANELSGIAVTRSTETFRWRLYLTSRLNSDATTYVYSALTNSPVITGFSPNLAYIDDGATDFTATGEVFSPLLASADLFGSAGNLTRLSVTPLSDMAFRIRAVPTGAPLGLYSLIVTNPDNRSAVMANVLNLDYRPGFTRLTDNLFRPLKGGQTKVDVTIYFPGVITATVYTLNGGLVKRLHNGPAPAGTLTFFWTGATDSGKIAASGLYLLRVTGPKLKETQKIVLIK
ncbi:MAG TPA: hypothetical protein DCZ93_10000 [Elusimicrobia bacterium]|nr:hypothetical protein [Elusimicrobiota bacterium]